MLILVVNFLIIAYLQIFLIHICFPNGHFSPRYQFDRHSADNEQLVIAFC